MSTTLLLLLSCLSPADDPTWPQFLGPDGKARASERPTTLELDEEHAQWRVPVPAGSSSPCIFGDRLFLSGHGGGKLSMLAYDRKSGKELWRYEVEAPEPVPIDHVDADAAAPTACTDGKNVFFYFGAVGLFAFDLDGEALWKKELPKPDASFGIGTSPILIGEQLILARDGCPDSGIYAYDKTTGKQLWERPRLGFTYSFGTPHVWRHPQRTELIVAGTKRLTSLDPKTGEELWELGGMTTFVCTTPTSDDERLYFAAWSTTEATQEERHAVGFGDLQITSEERADPSKLFARLDVNGDGKLMPEELPQGRLRDAFGFVDQNRDGTLASEEFVPLLKMPSGRGNTMVAVRPGGKGDLEAEHVAWKYRRGLPYVASPLLHEGRLYLAKAGGLLTCLDSATGKAHFDRERLDDRSEYYATPVGVPGHVIVCASGGTVYVVEAADEFRVKGRFDFGERIIATPAVVDGVIYLRSETSLWAFGE